MKYRVTLIVSLTPFLLQAQQLSGPLAIKQQSQFAVTVDAGLFQKTISETENKSLRYLLKVGYGLTDRFDFFVQAGATKLELLSGEQVFQDKLRLAYGMGLTFRPFYLKGLDISPVISGQLLRFISRPKIETETTVSGSYVTEVQELKYDWREAVFNVGVVKELSALNFYAGINLRLIHRDETRTESLRFNGNQVSGSQESATYQSGTLINPQIGTEILFPGRIILSLEVSANSSSDYVVFVGLSQIGKP